MKTTIFKNSDKLKEDSVLLQHISDSSPGAIYQFKMDKDGHYSFTYVSNGFEQLTGVAKELILNDTTSIFQNVESEDFQKFTESITESARNMSQWNHKFRLKRTDLGKSIWVKGTSNPEKKEDGSIVYVNDRGYIIHNKFDRPLRMVGAIKDITDVKLAEIEKQKLMDDLIKRNEALEQFTYIVSHNLRAPVANILGLSQAVQDNAMDEESRMLMTTHLHKAAESLDNVLKDLNHILNTNMAVNLKKDIVYFERLHDHIKLDLKEQIKNEGVEFKIDFEEAPVIKIVYTYLHNILLNLVTNSIKFRSEKTPLIKMQTYKDDRFIYLEYEDNGIGVDLDKFGHKIFGLYKVFHPEKKGKGMGLFMVKTQMDNLNGEITLSSKVGKGTKFYLKFNNLL